LISPPLGLNLLPEHSAVLSFIEERAFMNAMSPVEQYPQNCTFIREDWDILARHWYPVALARDLNAGPLPAVLLDQPLVIYRADGQIVVANDLCPHRGVPLRQRR
jgi:phenylpropionate dioxygenase-like ring-hydroxylating dioxygenase large terminal subunit